MTYVDLHKVIERFALAAHETGFRTAVDMNIDDILRIVDNLVDAAYEAGYQQAIDRLEEEANRWKAQNSVVGPSLGHVFHKAANIIRGPVDIVIMPDGTRSDDARGT